MNLDFYQFGFVTNDYQRAKGELIETHGLESFGDLLGISVSFVEKGPLRLNVGFAFAAGAQFELIEPLEGDDHVYRSVLPSSGYGFVLHHISRHFSRKEDLEPALTEAHRRWPLAMHGEMFGGSYHYFDSRRELGHFTELSCLPPEIFPPEALPRG